MSDSTEPCKMLWGRPLLPWQRNLGYFCTKSPAHWLVWQIDWRCLGLPGGFWGWPIRLNHAKCCGANSCCHGNEIWAEIQSPSGLSCNVRLFGCRMVLEVLGLPALSWCVCDCYGHVVGNGRLVGMSLLRSITDAVTVCSSCQCCQDRLQLPGY